jgi:signal peptidase I
LRFIKQWVQSVAIAVTTAFVLNLFVFNFSVVEGVSMEPTLKTGERLFVSKWTYRFEEPKRGDIVVLSDPNSDRLFVKRIVGTPGDKVQIEKKKLYINGVLLEEPYTDFPIEDGDYGPIVVLPGTVFVMGDNRHAQASMDSRDERIGLVPYELLEGRADFIFWPLSHWKSF